MSSAHPSLLGIAGSLRHGSYSAGVLRGLQESAKDRARIEIFALDAVPLSHPNTTTGSPAC